MAITWPAALSVTLAASSRQELVDAAEKLAVLLRELPDEALEDVLVSVDSLDDVDTEMN